MKSKRFIALAVLLVFVGSLVAGCGSDGKAIKIGAFYPLTGSNAIKGQFNKNGTQLAIDDINAKGRVLGKQIQIVYEDTQSKRENVPNVVRKLVENDKVVALLGEVASSSSIAAGPVVKQFGIPTIAPTSTNVRVTLDPTDNTKINPYYFRACFIDPLQGAVLSNFGLKNLGKKKAAILYNISADYNKALAQVFRENWTKAGGEILVEESYPDQTQDFKPQLTKIKNSNPEVVMIPNTYAENGLILKQAAELGLKTTFLLGDASHAPKLSLIHI